MKTNQILWRDELGRFRSCSIICVIRCVMAVSYAVRLRLVVGGAALDSRLACPPEDESLPNHRPIKVRLNGCSAPPRWVGGVESRDSITATQRHALIFLSLRKWKSVTELSRNAAIGRWGLALRETLISLQSTPEQAIDLPSYMTLITLQSGSKRAIALASPATLISLQSAPDSGGA